MTYKQYDHSPPLTVPRLCYILRRFARRKNILNGDIIANSRGESLNSRPTGQFTATLSPIHAPKEQFTDLIGADFLL